jgi:hypothetical protein
MPHRSTISMVALPVGFLRFGRGCDAAAGARNTARHWSASTVGPPLAMLPNAYGFAQT